jgi:hypothetical protein
VAGSVAESVVRETRDQARTLVDRRRAHRREPQPAGGSHGGRGPDREPAREERSVAPPDTRPRWRFKRRWVVVPVVVTCFVLVLVLVGLAFLVAQTAGVLGG